MSDKHIAVTENPKNGNAVHPRVVVSREGAAIRIEKTELTGALKRSLTTGGSCFGERRGRGNEAGR